MHRESSPVSSRGFRHTSRATRQLRNEAIGGYLGSVEIEYLAAFDPIILRGTPVIEPTEQKIAPGSWGN
jgi:hypothetical protein